MKKRLLASSLAIVLSLAMSMTTMAATWNDVNTWEKLETAFQDTDADVIIHLTGDIEWVSELEAGSDKTYTINGTQYMLSGVYLGGEGKVTINSKVEDLNTEEKVNITVNNDVKGEVATGDESVVIVNGNAEAVEAEEDSKVTINGNVTGISGNPDNVDMDDPIGYSDGTTGVYATDNAVVTVTGDVKGGDAYGSYAYAGDGVNAYDNANVTVGGNVTGGNVTAKQGVAKEGYESIAGDGIEASSTATVTVGGNVIGGNTSGNLGYAGTGIYLYLVEKEDNIGTVQEAQEAGKIYIEGTVKGGTATTDDGVDGEGIYLEGSASYYYLYPYSYDTDADFADFIINDVFDMFEYIYEEEVELTDQKKQEIESAYQDAVKAVYKEDTGNNLLDQNDLVDAITAALQSKNSEDDWYELRSSLAKCVNDAVDKIFALNTGENYVIPQVTVWSVEGGDSADKIATQTEKALEEIFKQEYLNYIIRVTQAPNGKVSVDKATAKAGETIKITATPDAGYELSKVFVSGKEIVAKDGAYTYTVQEGGAVDVTAVFTQITSPKTGDTQSVALWGMMLVASLGAIVILKRREA